MDARWSMTLSARVTRRSCTGTVRRQAGALRRARPPSAQGRAARSPRATKADHPPQPHPWVIAVLLAAVAPMHESAGRGLWSLVLVESQRKGEGAPHPNFGPPGDIYEPREPKFVLGVTTEAPRWATSSAVARRSDSSEGTDGPPSTPGDEAECLSCGAAEVPCRHSLRYVDPSRRRSRLYYARVWLLHNPAWLVAVQAHRVEARPLPAPAFQWAVSLATRSRLLSVDEERPGQRDRGSKAQALPAVSVSRAGLRVSAPAGPQPRAA
jgi:hypothetical protein